MPLPSRAQVQAQVSALLGPLASVQASYARGAKAHDLYEAVVLVTVMRIADLEGWAVSLEDTGGRPASSLLLRKAPGRLAHPSANFTHVVLRKEDRAALEVHLGIKVEGRSGVLHECDVAILPRRVAHECRDAANPRDPKRGEILWVAEAKFIASASVPLGYARGLLGLAVEAQVFSQTPSLALVCTQDGANSRAVLNQYGQDLVSTPPTAAGTVDIGQLVACVQSVLRSAP